MKESLTKLEKNIKCTKYIVLVVCIAVAAVAIMNGMNVAKYMAMDLTVYEVQLVDTGVNGTQEYRLFVDGVEQGVIDYNQYARRDFEGYINYKAATIIEAIGDVLDPMFLAMILAVLYYFLSGIKEGQTPFVKRSVICLNGIGILCIVFAFLSPVIRMLCSLNVYGYVVGQITAMDIFLVILGGVFEAIAAIFNYGIQLQEDSDLIA